MTRQDLWTGFRFLSMGAIALGTSYLVLYLLKDYGGFWYLGSSVFAMTLNYVMTFVLHKWVTYGDRSTDRLFEQIVQYALMVTVFVIFNAIGMYVLVDYAGMWYLYAQAIVSAVLTVVSMWHSPNIYRTS